MRILKGRSAAGILHGWDTIVADGLRCGRFSYQEIGEFRPDGLIRTSLFLLYCLEIGKDVLKDGVRRDELLLHADTHLIDLGHLGRFIGLHVGSVVFTHDEGCHPLTTLPYHP